MSYIVYGGDLDAGGAGLLDADAARRPGRALGAERVRLLAVGAVRERRLEQHVRRRRLTGGARRRRLRLVARLLVNELDALPVHLQWICVQSARCC